MAKMTIRPYVKGQENVAIDACISSFNSTEVGLLCNKTEDNFRNILRISKVLKEYDDDRYIFVVDYLQIIEVEQ